MSFAALYTTTSTFTIMQQSVKFMKKYLDKPGYVTGTRASELKDIYRAGLRQFDKKILSCFGRECYMGYCDLIKEFVESGRAPDLSGKETPYKIGYTMILITGARCEPFKDPEKFKYRESLTYLISKGVPLNIPDIAGYTALHMAVCNHGRNDLIARRSFTYLLIENGADINYRTRVGESPLSHAVGLKNCDDAEILLEHGADLDSPNSDGITPRIIASCSTPEMNVLVQKWSMKRSGEVAPRSVKACDACDKSDVALKNCFKCQVARYCSVKCQRRSWEMHKKTCKPLDSKTSVTIFPRYFKANQKDPTITSGNVLTFLTREIMKPEYDGMNLSSAFQSFKEDIGTVKVSSDSKRHAFTLPSGPFPKSIVVKIGIPMVKIDCPGSHSFNDGGPLVCYTKKRDLVCYILKEDAPDAYYAVWSHIKAGHSCVFCRPVEE